MVLTLQWTAILWLVILIDFGSFGLQPGALLVSRSNFLVSLSLPFSPLSPQNKTYESQSVEIPLKFLPLGGCLAVKISLNDKRNDNRIFAYSAIVDTGSPFLTAPPEIQPYSKAESNRYPPTQEQYGETVDNMQWESISNIELLTTDFTNPLAIPQMIVGLPGTNVVDDTGGIFLGLMLQDKSRPTLLHQLGYRSFVLDYPQRLLVLSRQTIIEPLDPEALELFDLSPYGDNIHHYGILCPSFTLESLLSKTSVTISSLNRPVVAVIDSGLTGCVFSDSLRDELVAKGYGRQLEWEELSGVSVSLPKLSGESLVLKSNPEYWSLTSFKLPWFYEENTHPHVIAMGATFLAKNSKVSIDPFTKRAKIALS